MSQNDKGGVSFFLSAQRAEAAVSCRAGWQQRHREGIVSTFGEMTNQHETLNLLLVAQPPRTSRRIKNISISYQKYLHRLKISPHQRAVMIPILMEQNIP